jgi:hypothetical protein
MAATALFSGEHCALSEPFYQVETRLGGSFIVGLPIEFGGQLVDGLYVERI